MEVILSLFGFFGNTRRSEWVDGRCSICGTSIKYLYSPVDTMEYSRLFSYQDLDIINICKGCGNLRHAACSARRHNERASPPVKDPAAKPTLLKALQEIAERGDHTMLDNLTKGLECPSCGSFAFSSAFLKRDGTRIEVKSGRRVK
jgi:hypothetical protein